MEGQRIKNAATVQAALAAAGATQQEATARSPPRRFTDVPRAVFTVSQARYNELEPTIYPIPGTVFQTSDARSAVTPGLASGIVGTVGPITAQDLGQLAHRTTLR